MAGGPLGLFLQMPCGQEEGEGRGGGALARSGSERAAAAP